MAPHGAMVHFFRAEGRIADEGDDRASYGVMSFVPLPSDFSDHGLRLERPRWSSSFYSNDVSAGSGFGLPPISPFVPESRDSWEGPSSLEHRAITGQTCARLRYLVGGGLTVMDLLTFWRKRQVKPLQARAHTLCF